MPLSEGDFAEVMRIRRLASLHWDAWLFHEACNRGIFTALEQGPSTPEVLAKRLQLNPDAIALLLEALVELDLVQFQEGYYQNTTGTSQFLVMGTAADQTGIIGHYRASVQLFQQWRSVYEQDYQRPLEKLHGPESTKELVRASHNTASVLAPWVVQKIPLGTQEHLLDLGAGSGTYTICLAQSQTDLQATLVDFPAILEEAQHYLEGYGVADRTQLLSGDLFEVDWGSGFTLALISNVLHMLSPTQCAELIHKTTQSLQSGGRLIIHEPLFYGHAQGPMFSAVFAMNLYVKLPHGKVYVLPEVKNWLQAAGLSIDRVEDLSPAPTHLITATKP